MPNPMRYTHGLDKSLQRAIGPTLNSYNPNILGTVLPVRSKYGNKKVEYDGHKFDSMRERDRYMELCLLKRAKDPKDRVVKIDCQRVFKLIVNNRLICKYIADFEVTYADGRVEIEDSKGMLTKEYILKRKLMSAIHDIQIKEV